MIWPAEVRHRPACAEAVDRVADALKGETRSIPVKRGWKVVGDTFSPNLLSVLRLVLSSCRGTNRR